MGSGLTAKNAQKTHCKNGHEFTEENTILVPRDGGARVERWCKTCHLDKQYMRRYGVPRPREDGQILMDDPRGRDEKGKFMKASQ